MKDISQTQKDIKNNLNISSSPMPAVADARIEVGNGGCGKRPIELKLLKI